MKDDMELTPREIKELITEYGLTRNVSYDKAYFTHNMPEFIAVMNATIAKCLSLLNSEELREKIAKIFAKGLYNTTLKEVYLLDVDGSRICRDFADQILSLIQEEK